MLSIFFLPVMSRHCRDDIDEIEPDEFDLMLLEKIRNNPECHEFVSQEEALKELRLDLIIRHELSKSKTAPVLAY